MLNIGVLSASAGAEASQFLADSFAECVGDRCMREGKRRGDAIDQGGQFVIVVHIGIEIALLLHDDFGAAGGQANEIEAEAGIERIAQGIEPLAKQAVDHISLRHRPPGIDRDRAHRAVGAKETGVQPPQRRCCARFRANRREPQAATLDDK